jgi:hypothetical protein
MSFIDRRSLLKSSALLLYPALHAAIPATAEPAPPVGRPQGDGGVHELYPTQDPEQVREMVGVSHFSLEKVTALVASRPTLAKAAWDWGFGDWETALGAASHMGQREIARFLIAQGAPPTIFSAAMLGQLDVVKSLVLALPGIERVKGPHGIPLLDHAMAGGDASAPVADFLKTLDPAGSERALAPLSEQEVKMLSGNYVFGKGPRDRFEVSFADSRLGIARTGGTRRFLFHRGDFDFYPAGAESVHIRFSVHDGRATALTVNDSGSLRAVRS